MPASIGVNLRVTGNCRQGGRKYMEDCFSVAYQVSTCFGVNFLRVFRNIVKALTRKRTFLEQKQYFLTHSETC